MSDSDTRPELDEQEEEGNLEDSLDTVLSAIESVPPILSGEPVDVTLTIKVANAMTPQEAVDQFMATLVRNGSDRVYFFIEDESSGEMFAIKGGVLHDPQELFHAASEDDEDDEDVAG